VREREAMPVNKDVIIIYDVQKTREAPRVGAKIGGDFVKKAYADSPET